MSWASQVAQRQSIYLPEQEMLEMQVPFLAQKDPLEEEMVTHSTIAWRIPWAEEPGGLKSIGSQRAGPN